MSKFLSIAGLQTTLGVVKSYVDKRSQFYFSYPAMPVYPEANPELTDNGIPHFNARSLEMRAYEDEEQRLFYPITTIDSILVSGGSRLWIDAFSEELDSRLRPLETSHSVYEAMKMKRTVGVSNWTSRNIPEDSSILRLITLLTGMSPVTDIPEDGSEILVLDVSDEIPVWSVEFRADGKYHTLTVCDAEGNSDFELPPLIRLNGRDFIADMVGLRPPDTYIACETSPIDPIFQSSFFENFIEITRSVVNRYELDRIKNISSVIFFYQEEGSEPIIERLPLVIKTMRDEDGSGVLDITYHSAIAEMPWINKLAYVRIMIYDNIIYYSREPVQY